MNPYDAARRASALPDQFATRLPEDTLAGLRIGPGRGHHALAERAATPTYFFEAQTGTARRASLFEQGPEADHGPAATEPRNDFPAATRATAAAFISQHMPSAAPKDAQ